MNRFTVQLELFVGWSYRVKEAGAASFSFCSSGPLPIGPSFFVQVSLTLKAEAGPHVQGRRLKRLTIMQENRNSILCTGCRATSGLACSHGNGNVGGHFSRLKVSVRGFDRVVEDNKAFLLETHHDLTVVD
jgi:hypothetical protein